MKLFRKIGAADRARREGYIVARSYVAQSRNRALIERLKYSSDRGRCQRASGWSSVRQHEQETEVGHRRNENSSSVS